MEVFNFINEAQPVKETLISLERLRCRRRVEPYAAPEAIPMMMEMAKRQAEEEILQEIRKYISIEEITPIECEAGLCLPLIYDDAMKAKDVEVELVRLTERAATRARKQSQAKVKELMSRNLWQRPGWVV